MRRIIIRERIQFYRPKRHHVVGAVVALVLLGLISFLTYSIATHKDNNVQPVQPVVNVHSAFNIPLPANTTPDTLPNQVRVQHWTRIDTPPGYPTLMRACMGKDGVYVDQFGADYVVPSDPECGGIDPPK